MLLDHFVQTLVNIACKCLVLPIVFHSKKNRKFLCSKGFSFDTRTLCLSFTAYKKRKKRKCSYLATHVELHTHRVEHFVICKRGCFLLEVILYEYIKRYYFLLGGLLGDVLYQRFHCGVDEDIFGLIIPNQMCLPHTREDFVS